jgi:hypothetical protein
MYDIRNKFQKDCFRHRKVDGVGDIQKHRKQGHLKNLLLFFKIKKLWLTFIQIGILVQKFGNDRHKNNTAHRIPMLRER